MSLRSYVLHLFCKREEIICMQVRLGFSQVRNIWKWSSLKNKIAAKTKKAMQDEGAKEFIWCPTWKWCISWSSWSLLCHSCDCKAHRLQILPSSHRLVVSTKNNNNNKRKLKTPIPSASEISLQSNNTYALIGTKNTSGNIYLQFLCCKMVQHYKYSRWKLVQPAAVWEPGLVGCPCLPEAANLLWRIATKLLWMFNAGTSFINSRPFS